MKTLVVGGAGFIGSHLIDVLSKYGHEIICVDDLSLGTKENIGRHMGKRYFRFCQKDASDIAALSEVFEEGIEYVFHLAANSDIQASAKNPAIEYKNTYTTTFNVLSCMREYGVKKLFFASTSAVYGDKPGETLSEDTPNLEPISYYGACKLGSEALISAFCHMNDFSALVLRFPNVIGPRLTHGVVYDFVKKLSDNPERLTILGDGKQAKPYIYVDDLVEAIIKFMDTGKDGVTLYNLGVESATSVTRIADILCEEMKLCNVEYDYTGGRGGWKGDVPRFKYCLDRIHNAGWHARYESDEAVRMAVRAALLHVAER